MPKTHPSLIKFQSSQHRTADAGRWVRLMLDSRLMSILLYVLIMGLIIRVLMTGAQAIGYNWQWYRVSDYILEMTDDGFQVGELLLGLVTTIDLTFRSFALAVAIGLVIALLQLSSLMIGSRIAIGFIEFVRNLPLLVLLYLIYYVVGPIFDLGRFTASVLCLAVYHSVLVAEIFRAAIQAVPLGQWEAARAIGLSTPQCYRYILIPQSVKFILPPLTGEAVHLIKSSAIVSVIAVAELTTMGRNIISDTYMSFEIWFTVAAIYLIFTLILSIFVTFLEKKFEVIN